MTTRVRAGGIASNTIANSMLHTSFSVDSDVIAANAIGPSELNTAANYTFTGDVGGAGKIVNITRWTTTDFNGSTSSTSYVTLATLSLTATPGNLIYVSGDFPCRGSANSGWQLTMFQWNDAVSGNVWASGYVGVNTYEGIMSQPLAFSYTWSGAATHNVSMQVKSYGALRYYGASNQQSETTTPVITIFEIST